MPYVLPADVDERPVGIDGADTLGCQIASVYAAGGSDVRISGWRSMTHVSTDRTEHP